MWRVVICNAIWAATPKRLSFMGAQSRNFGLPKITRTPTATLNKIAEAYRQIGDYRASAQWYDYSLEESRRAGDVDAQMTALLRLYYLAAQIGDQSALAKYEQQGERACHQRPPRSFEGMGLCYRRLFPCSRRE